MPRQRPAPTATEAAMLTQYLDLQRATVEAKCAALDHDQIGRMHPPSALTAGGLLFHLALVEEDWMEVRFAGLPGRQPWVGVDWDVDPDWEFRVGPTMEPTELIDRYRVACARSRRVAAEASGLDQLSAESLGDSGQRFSLRWVLLHLIEETARHVGHLDLLREAIDGAVGE